MRYEYKYIVPNSLYFTLKRQIQPYIELDKYIKNSVTDDYTVRSIYFDNNRFSCYFEKIDGIKNRKKFRIRGYSNNNGSSNVFFEIKRKYDVPIVKNRIAYSYNDILEIFERMDFTGFIAIKNGKDPNYRNVNRFFYHILTKNFKPVVLIIYEREAYFDKFKKENRITFDKNLRSIAFPRVDELFKNDDQQYILNNSFILEVKFNDHFPVWLEPILNRFGLKKQSASKYVMGIDALGINTNSSRSFYKSGILNNTIKTY